MNKKELEILHKIVNGLISLAYEQNGSAITLFEYACVEIRDLIKNKMEEE